MPKDFAELRTDYETAGLDVGDVPDDPLALLSTWLDEALDAGLYEPHAMTLATASADGAPSARIVLLRGLDARGLAFYTNYESRKGRELDANPRAALTFYWAPFHRQVRVEGPVERVGAAESDAYFASRPIGSQRGAWASPQSAPLADRDELERRVHEVQARFGDEIPRPPHWGGFRLSPTRVEFWQGRPSRLHDRVEYARDAGGDFVRRRLAP